MKQTFRHETYEGLYFRREVPTGRPQDAERADILDVLVENRYEPSIEAIRDENNAAEFFSDAVFVEKFKMLDAVSTSEFHTYKVSDLVLPLMRQGR